MLSWSARRGERTRCRKAGVARRPRPADGPAAQQRGPPGGPGDDRRQVDGLTLGLGVLACLATYLWVFASLAAVQLTVRLILRFDVRETAVAALWLSAAVVVVGALLLQLSNGAIDPAVVERLRQQCDAAGVGGRL